MVATRGRTFKRPWRRSYHSSKLKSSSAPTGRKDSWCFHAVGSSNAPLLGSTAAEGLPRIGRTSIATRWRSCGLPQSASCSENFVIPPDVFGQTLSRGDVLGAERKFVEIADTVRKIKEKADVVEARAIFEAAKLAEERIDWRAASAHYARAARLQPSNWQYTQGAGRMTHAMGDYATAASFEEATLSLATSAFGPDAQETAAALNNLALTYHRLAR